MRRSSAAAILWPALALLLQYGPAHAGANLIVNGDFETTTLTASGQMDTADVSGWSTTGYNFLYFPGTADTTGANTNQFGCCTKLWGPNDGSANGLTASSPTGGNYIAADGAFEIGAITQTVNGLQGGGDYMLTFYWAAGQQQGFTGPNTESWGVTFGSQAYNTVTVNNTSQGFVPWRKESVVFEANQTSQVLSFLATGTPSGQPPFSLLDGVSLTLVPEPAPWALLVAALVASACLPAVFRRSGVKPPQPSMT